MKNPEGANENEGTKERKKNLMGKFSFFYQLSFPREKDALHKSVLKNYNNKLL